MSVAAAELLRLLGSGVRPVDGPELRAAPIEGVNFGSLLRRAEEGVLASGRAVRPGANVEGALSAEQLERLAPAADAAEAAGATRLAALIDGVLVQIDIPTREAVAATRLDEAPAPTPGGVMTDVDAVVIVPTEGDAEETESGAAERAGAATPAHGRAPSLLVTNPAVAELLAGIRTRPGG